MEVHVFQHGMITAFTIDKDGKNLPVEHGPFEYRKTTILTPDDTRIAVNSAEAFDQVQKHGFYISRSTIRVAAV